MDPLNHIPLDADPEPPPPARGCACRVAATTAGSVLFAVCGAGGLGYQVELSPSEAEDLAATLADCAAAVRSHAESN